MKILFISSLYPTPERPALGVYNGRFVESLSREATVCVVSPRPWWERRGPSATPVSAPAPVIQPRYLGVPGIAWLSAYGQFLSTRNLMAHLHAREQFDFVFASWIYPDGVAAAAFAEAIGLPLVLYALGSDINFLAQRPLIRGQVRRALQQAELVVSVSSALSSRLVDLGTDPRKIHVQLNAVDGAHFRIRSREKAREALNWAGGSRLVLYVGNLRAEKGVHVLLRAAEQFVTADRHLVLVGDGPERDSVQRHIHEHPALRGRVMCVGSRPSFEIASWMAASDVLVLPSYREGCPNVVLESLACGRPVVASSVGGVPELITDGVNGTLVSAGNAASLSKAVNDTLACSWDEVQLRQTVPYLSWDVVARQVLDRYQRKVGCMQLADLATFA